MDFASTVVLGGFAGFTIFIGLPVARLQNLSPHVRAFLNALAVGILVFLLYDVLGKASDPIHQAITDAHTQNVGNLIVLVLLFALGLGVSLLGLVYFDRVVIRRVANETRTGEATPSQLALMIAIGIGLHNFAEGLAIGQSARAGAISLATILIVGFALHNATEGFGVASPFTSGAGKRPSWRQLGLLGLIAGGPTFLGTIVGYSVYSTPVFVLSLALAAGSILYVVAELLNAGRKIGMRELAMWGMFAGFIAAYLTDLILTWGGS